MSRAIVDTELRKQLERLFEPLNSRPAGDAFPRPLALATALEANCQGLDAGGAFHAPPRILALFATAAVEGWLRALHSFLVSAAITDASPIWAGIAGYYSSHYCMRAFAHLLGHFQLFRLKLIVNLEESRPICVVRKKRDEREHAFYWKAVKKHRHFAGDPLFTNNPDDAEVSDAANRNRTTYSDHFSQALRQFRVVGEEALRARVRYISRIEVPAPPIPRRSRAPDIESVQIVAYHRIMRFRGLLDEVLPVRSRFWSIYRKPSWASEWTDFQLVEARGLGDLPL